MEHSWSIVVTCMVIANTEINSLTNYITYKSYEHSTRITFSSLKSCIAILLLHIIIIIITSLITALWQQILFMVEVLRRFCLISVIGSSAEILGSSISESTGSVIDNESVSTMLGASVVFDSVTLMNVGRLDGGDCDDKEQTWWKGRGKTWILPSKYWWIITSWYYTCWWMEW